MPECMKSPCHHLMQTEVTRGTAAGGAPNHRLRELRAKQRKHPWRVHQSTAGVNVGRCCWTNCQGIKRGEANGNKRARGNKTHLYCEAGLEIGLT
eukprot:scaffold11731_cov42-Cyclotella_meneghiniana.AAC.4